jgi:hypothetical protein
MAYQTIQFLGNLTISINLVLFIFFSTVCSYNFHWYLTPRSSVASRRVLWTEHHKVLHVVLYFIGLGGSLFYFYLLRDHWLAIGFGTVVTFLYSAPKLPQTFFRDIHKIAIGKTFFLAFVWTYVTAGLPLIVSNLGWNSSFTFFVLSRFFLIYAICILFDYRDREDDKRDNIRSMITYLNERGIKNLFIMSIFLFAGATILLRRDQYTWTSITILLVPGIIVALLFNQARKNFSDYLYYVLLDGLMMLSALIMLLFRI